MSIEIEAKMRLRSPEAFLKKLEQAKAKPVGKQQELNIFFDTPDHRLRSADEGLRIRITTDEGTGKKTTKLTHKGPRAHGRLKHREEAELEIADSQAMMNILEALGYEDALSFEKVREMWLLDGCEIVIDQLPYLGTFVEIEGETEKSVMSMREKLGLAEEPLIRSSYASILQAHLTENRIALKYIPMDVSAVTP